MNKFRYKRGFTLIELIVVMAVIGILVLLAIPRFMGHTEKARLTEVKNNIKQLENASERYYIDKQEWPRLSNEPYTKEQLESFAQEIKDKTGTVITLDENGKYYPIDYSKLQKYVQKPKHDIQYVIQNPIGEVYYLNDLTEQGKQHFDTIKNNPSDKNEVNKKPTAVITMTPDTNILIDTTISWSYSKSNDIDGDSIVNAEWDGMLSQYSTPGTYTVKLRVQNSKGIWSDWVSKTFIVSPAFLYSNINISNLATNITAYPTASLFGTYVFDNNTSSTWQNDYLPDTKRYIKWQMPNGRAISKLNIMSGANSSGYTGLSSFRLYASNTGAFNGEEVLLYSGINPLDYSYHEHKFINTTKYTWYKLEGDWASGQANRCHEIQLFEGKLANINPPTGDFLYYPLTASTTTKIVYNTTYFDEDGDIMVEQEWQLNDGPVTNTPPQTIPTAGNNKLSYRVKDELGVWSEPVIKYINVVDVTYSGTNISNLATNITVYPTAYLNGTNIFDNNTSSTWQNNYLPDTKRYIKWQMLGGKAISKMNIMSGANTSGYTGLSSFRLYGSNTGDFNGEETLIFYGTNIQDNSFHPFDFVNTTKYTWYKLEGDWLAGQANRCYEVQLFEIVN